jgi:hypothetical protein
MCCFCCCFADILRSSRATSISQPPSRLVHSLDSHTKSRRVCSRGFRSNHPKLDFLLRLSSPQRSMPLSVEANTNPLITGYANNWVLVRNQSRLRSRQQSRLLTHLLPCAHTCMRARLCTLMRLAVPANQPHWICDARAWHP